MACFPLLFQYRSLIEGNGFVASVAADGRALLVEEDGGYWMYGVNPGGAAGGGASRDAAFNDFKQAYLSVLFDAALEATTFEAFKAEVERFFNEENQPTAKRWLSARGDVQQDRVACDLEKVDADSRPARIEVVRVSHATASHNQLDRFARAA